MKKLVLSILSFTALNAMAAEIGPAGCGLGNVMMGGNDSQILVATTNGTGTQTFGITSGTSNCVDAGGMAKIEVFVEANKYALANDVARGQGETIAGLSQVLRCNSSAAVGRVLKQNYNQIFSSEGNSNEISAKIRESLVKESPVAVYCQGLS